MAEAKPIHLNLDEEPAAPAADAPIHLNLDLDSPGEVALPYPERATPGVTDIPETSGVPLDQQFREVVGAIPTALARFGGAVAGMPGTIDRFVAGTMKKVFGDEAYRKTKEFQQWGPGALIGTWLEKKAVDPALEWYSRNSDYGRIETEAAAAKRDLAEKLLYDPTYIWRNLASQAPQMILSAGSAGMAAKGVGLIGQAMIPALLQVGEVRDNLRRVEAESGPIDDFAFGTAALVGGGIGGALELLGAKGMMGQLQKYIPGSAAKKFFANEGAEIMAESLLEGGTEWAQNIATNASVILAKKPPQTLSEFYDTITSPTFRAEVNRDGAESFFLGAVGGGFFSLGRLRQAAFEEKHAEQIKRAKEGRDPDGTWWALEAPEKLIRGKVDPTLFHQPEATVKDYLRSQAQDMDEKKFEGVWRIAQRAGNVFQNMTGLDAGHFWGMLMAGGITGQQPTVSLRQMIGENGAKTLDLQQFDRYTAATEELQKKKTLYEIADLEESAAMKRLETARLSASFRGPVPTPARIATLERQVEAASKKAEIAHNELSVAQAVVDQMRAATVVGPVTGNLAEAKRALSVGEDPESIRQRTGWWVGPDTKWSYEVSDANSRVLVPVDQWATRVPGLRKKLGEVFSSDIFEAYPEARGIEVAYLPTPKKVGGYFDPVANLIVISDRTGKKRDGSMDEEEVRKVLHHELQHWVQKMEGFALGGNQRVGFYMLSAKAQHSIAADALASAQADISHNRTQWRIAELLEKTPRLDAAVMLLKTTGGFGTFQQLTMQEKQDRDQRVKELASEIRVLLKRTPKEAPLIEHYLREIMTQHASPALAKEHYHNLGKQRRAFIDSITDGIKRDDVAAMYNAMEQSPQEYGEADLLSAYLSLAGEMQARAVELRMGLSQKALRALPIDLTMKNDPHGMDLDPVLRMTESEGVKPDRQPKALPGGIVASLPQGQGPAVKGVTHVFANGRSLIEMFAVADESTFLHEMGHFFRQSLYAMEKMALPENKEKIRTHLDALESWAGVKDGVWTSPAEERWAEGIEKYLRSGKAPIPKLQRLFDQFKTWLRAIYDDISAGHLATFSPAVEKLFDELILDVPAMDETTPTGKKLAHQSAEDRNAFRLATLLRDLPGQQRQLQTTVNYLREWVKLAAGERTILGDRGDLKTVGRQASSRLRVASEQAAASLQRVDGWVEKLFEMVPTASKMTGTREVRTKQEKTETILEVGPTTRTVKKTRMVPTGKRIPIKIFGDKEQFFQRSAANALANSKAFEDLASITVPFNLGGRVMKKTAAELVLPFLVLERLDPVTASEQLRFRSDAELRALSAYARRFFNGDVKKAEFSLKRRLIRDLGPALKAARETAATREEMRREEYIETVPVPPTARRVTRPVMEVTEETKTRKVPGSPATQLSEEELALMEEAGIDPTEPTLVDETYTERTESPVIEEVVEKVPVFEPISKALLVSLLTDDDALKALAYRVGDGLKWMGYGERYVQQAQNLLRFIGEEAMVYRVAVQEQEDVNTLLDSIDTAVSRKDVALARQQAAIRLLIRGMRKATNTTLPDVKAERDEVLRLAKEYSAAPRRLLKFIANDFGPRLEKVAADLVDAQATYAAIVHAITSRGVDPQTWATYIPTAADPIEQAETERLRQQVRDDIAAMRASLAQVGALPLVTEEEIDTGAVLDELRHGVERSMGLDPTTPGPTMSMLDREVDILQRGGLDMTTQEAVEQLAGPLKRLQKNFYAAIVEATEWGKRTREWVMIGNSMGALDPTLYDPDRPWNRLRKAMGQERKVPLDLGPQALTEAKAALVAADGARNLINNVTIPEFLKAVVDAFPTLKERQLISLVRDLGKSNVWALEQKYKDQWFAALAEEQALQKHGTAEQIAAAHKKTQTAARRLKRAQDHVGVNGGGLSPRMAYVLKQLEGAFDSWQNAAIRAGLWSPEAFHEDYLPRIYRKQDLAAARARFAEIMPLNGPNKHGFKRVFETIVEAYIVDGLQPATLDVSVLVENYTRSLADTIEKAKLTRKLQSIAPDVFEWVEKGKRPQTEGFVDISQYVAHAKIPSGPHTVDKTLYAHPILANPLKAFASVSVFDSDPTLNKLKKMNMWLKKIQLAIDLYHLWQITRVAAASGVYGEGATKIPFKAALEALGAMDSRDVRHPLVREFMLSGLQLSAGDWARRKMHEEFQREYIDKLGQGAKLYHVMGEHTEQFSRWMWEKYVPGLKIIVATKHLESLLANPDTNHLPREALVRAAATVTNDKFGGMAWSLKGRSKSVSDLMSMVFLAPDWLETRLRNVMGVVEKGPEGNLWREYWFGEGLMDAVRGSGASTPKRWATGYLVQGMMLHAFGNMMLAGVGAALGAGFGWPPEEERDAANKERTGFRWFTSVVAPITDKRGHPLEISFFATLDYFRAFLGDINTIAPLRRWYQNRQAPLLRGVAEMARGTDYTGKPYRADFFSAETAGVLVDMMLPWFSNIVAGSATDVAVSDRPGYNIVRSAARLVGGHTHSTFPAEADAAMRYYIDSANRWNREIGKKWERWYMDVPVAGEIMRAALREKAMRHNRELAAFIDGMARDKAMQPTLFRFRKQLNNARMLVPGTSLPSEIKQQIEDLRWLTDDEGLEGLPSVE